MLRRPPRSTRPDTLFPYTTPFRSLGRCFDPGPWGCLLPVEVVHDSAVGEQFRDDHPRLHPCQFPSGYREPRCRMVAYRKPEECLQRSEEHTSELQSLMRISYAVFCLKKKKKTQKRNTKPSFS